MLPRLSLLFVLFFLLSVSTVKSQSVVSIPAYTAYTIPVDESNEEDESKMFSFKDGIHNWNNPEQQIQFYFRIRSKGNLQLALLLKNKNSGRQLSVSVAGKVFKISVPQSDKFKRVTIGSVAIIDTGFYSVIISAAGAATNSIADIKSLELAGDAAKNIHFNAKPRRNAASVHLFYPIADTVKVFSFYNEISIPRGADELHSYYMACGFTRGYFGIQVNSPTERRVIFSVWDAGNEAVDRNKVSSENKVQLIAKGADVFADGFGNEGTGGHSHWIFNWKTEETYKFLVTATIDSALNSTTYTGYFFIPDIQKWKLIASFKAPKDGKPLRRLYSFVENFWGTNGQLYRKAYFGNQWIRNAEGQWQELTASTFSFDATGKAGDRIDYGAGSEGTKFYLWNGGFVTANAQFGDQFTRVTTGGKPLIDLYKNADSAVEARLENEIIFGAIRDGKLDTTGSTNGIYYHILREGTGKLVSITDTVVVHYKAKLFNGEIVDETKDEPAVFPLKRLIKGWQAGLGFCRKGGKIRLIIPSSLAYSIRNLGDIPPNSILIFDIEVLDIQSLP